MKEQNNFNTDDDIEILEEAFDGNLDALYEDDFEFENTRRMRNRMRIRNSIIGTVFFLVLTVVIGLIMMGIYADGQKVVVTNSYIAKREYYEVVTSDYKTLNNFVVVADGQYTGTLYSDFIYSSSLAAQNANYEALNNKLSNIISNKDEYINLSKKYATFSEFNFHFLNCAEEASNILNLISEDNFVVTDDKKSAFESYLNQFYSSSQQMSKYYNDMTTELSR